MLEDDSLLFEAEVTILCALLATLGLARFTRLAWERRGLDLKLVLLVAFGVRVAVVLAQSLLGETGESLRGTDDPVSLLEANVLAETPIEDRLWWDTFTGDFHIVFFAAQTWLLGGPGGTSLRVLQAALAVLAIGLVALGVERLAGRRAALLAGWFLALEPTSVLFSTILHKESFVLLGESAVVLGLAECWSRRTLQGLPVALAGVGLVWLVRPYAGFFLMVAVAGVAAYLLVSRADARWRRISVAGVAAVALFGGTVALAVSGNPLERAQALQNEDPAARDNLQLEPVDLTTVGGLARGVPRRIRDFLLRPYPWQAANLSQRLGVAGTLIAWALYLLLAYGLITCGRTAIVRAAPFLWTSVVVTLCYALSTANAGTGYRHRVQLLLVLSAAICTLWRDRLPALSDLPRRATARVARGGPATARS